MGPVRLILIGIVIWLVWRAIAANRQQGAVKRKPRPGIGRMVRCDQCGLFVPADEALRSGSRAFCCEAHRRQATASGEDA